MWQVLAHFFGLNNGSGTGYLFWSGVGSDLAYLAGFGAVWKHLNCHTKGCWRVGLHKMGGTDDGGTTRIYRLCSHCHPHRQPKQTREVIHAAIAKAQDALSPEPTEDET